MQQQYTPGLIRLGASDRTAVSTSPSSSNIANEISDNPTFQALAAQAWQERESQAMQHSFIYAVSGAVLGLQTLPFNLLIESGSDFQCLMMTASAFSYDAVNATIFPVPNSLGIVTSAGDGLSVQITDTASGRQLTNGFVSIRNIGTPGYGVNMVKPLPFRYHFKANSILRFDVRSRETNAARSQSFEFALIGLKTFLPQ
jgi:hypothetical protein